MVLINIVKNSNYITDEEIIDSNIVGITNSAIAEINSRCSTNLPFATNDNLQTISYIAMTDTWQLRLFEPYISYSIAANDGDVNNRDFHYNRFLQALSEFKENGLGSILETDPGTGEDTGYAGNSANIVPIDASEVTFSWEGWI